MTQFTEGQKLWFDPANRHSTSCEVTVAKIGRKWVAYTAGYSRFIAGRFDQTDGSLERGWPVDGQGFTSLARIWISQDAAEAHRARSRAWHAFRRAVYDTHSTPIDINLQDIESAAALLKLNLEIAP